MFQFFTKQGNKKRQVNCIWHVKISSTSISFHIEQFSLFQFIGNVSLKFGAFDIAEGEGHVCQDCQIRERKQTAYPTDIVRNTISLFKLAS